jgi:hypothetical protein
VRAVAGPAWKRIVGAHERGREVVHVYAKLVRDVMKILILAIDRKPYWFR